MAPLLARVVLLRSGVGPVTVPTRISIRWVRLTNPWSGASAVVAWRSP